ncbi:MAG: TolC family protein [Lewinellaceae bacterium]|nr:TolC family protein [Phaeodactylibacter sp.]MCB9041895.1 TolC family protein [Lewinellaceae bacterium]
MQQTIARLEKKLLRSLWQWAFILAMLAPAAAIQAQAIPLSLDQAFEVASRNYPLLKRDRQFIEQQNALIRSAASRPPTGVFISGDEVDPRSSRGIHSLGLQQDFNWPGTKGRREEAIRQQGLLGNARLELGQLELRKEVAFAYYEVLYARSLQELMQQQVNLFTDMVELAQLRFELGETGKIPVLSAQGKQKEATLAQLQASEDYEIALTIFNNWMYSDTAYEVAGRALPEPAGYFNWYVNSGHPLLLFQQQQANVAQAQILAEQNKLLPQIRTAGLLQMVNADSPFFGYQLGLNIPLSQRSIRARIEGAEMQAEMRETELDAARQQLENDRRRLASSLKKEQMSLDYIRQEMLPLAREQIDASRKAYAQGAVEYQDYLRNLEQAMQARLQYLHILKRYNLLKLELEFLSGRR